LIVSAGVAAAEVDVALFALVAMVVDW